MADREEAAIPFDMSQDPFHWRNVFDYLDAARRLDTGHSLRELQHLLEGYDCALHVHALDEQVPSMRHFFAWLQHRVDWAPATGGWAEALLKHAGTESAARQEFFSLVDDYRQLRPTVIARVALTERHGSGPRGVPPPRRLELVQYAPEPLVFLRLHYARHFVDEQHAPEPGGAYRGWSVARAQAWAQEQLGVAPGEWELLGPNPLETF